MNKKILRLLSLTLAFLLMTSIVKPAPANAVAYTVEEVKQQIVDTYKDSCAFYGRTNFKGYCGSLTNAQLHLLGITTNVIHADGNDAYDTFANLSVTNGGYSVKAYPGSVYSLKSALNDITKNGTRDAYNILVGFQESPTVLGRRYGHSLLIHAIIDGTIYFVESYDVNLRGTWHAEGTPLTASIDEFDAYYARTTTKFDGVIYFGMKTYADSCTRYSSNALGIAAVGAQVWRQPCDDTIRNDAKLLNTLEGGEQVNITAVYLNTEGEYWYELDEGKTGFVRAEELSIGQLRYDDVTLTGSVAPTMLVQGKGYNVKGNILSEYSKIYSIRARVYRPETDQLVQVIDTTDTVNGTGYNLLRSKISDALTFRKLEAGEYRYELAAIVNNCYVENGQLMTGWDTVVLWSSDFVVLDKKATVYTVSFDTCGGTTPVDQTIVLKDQTVGTLPTPQRSGYVFLGWFTQKEGGERITAEFAPTQNTTCYARWVSQEQLRELWMGSGNCWYLYSDGISTMACMEIDNTLYYFSSLEPMCQSWMVWTDAGAV